MGIIGKWGNTFIESQLGRSTGGILHSLGATANDFGFHRRRLFNPNNISDEAHLDNWFGRQWITPSQAATTGLNPGMSSKYVVPHYEKGVLESRWRLAENLDEAKEAWRAFGKEAAEGPAWKTLGLAKVRNKILSTEKGASFYAKFGGPMTMLGSGFTAWNIFSGAKDGYKEDGIAGGIVGGGKGLLRGISENWAMGYIALNPLVSGAVLAAAGTGMYATNKLFSVKNESNAYLKGGRLGNSNWNKGPSPGMDSLMANTIRQRSLMAMENSRFNTMRTLGMEAYMQSMPRTRYANSSVMPTPPMMSY